jgi:hypothetical protein
MNINNPSQLQQFVSPLLCAFGLSAYILPEFCCSLAFSLIRIGRELCVGGSEYVEISTVQKSQDQLFPIVGALKW